MRTSKLIYEMKKEIKKWESIDNLPEWEFVRTVKSGIFRLDKFFNRYVVKGRKR